MSDTIELLEAIGRDAALRRASPEELARALEAANASAGLRELAANGDDTGLTRELGLGQLHVEHHSQTAGHEDVDDDKQDDDKDNKDDEPNQLPDDPLPN